MLWCHSLASEFEAVRTIKGEAIDSCLFSLSQSAPKRRAGEFSRAGEAGNRLAEPRRKVEPKTERARQF
jgi:hypothetical protein